MCIIFEYVFKRFYICVYYCLFYSSKEIESIYDILVIKINEVMKILRKRK